MIEWMHARGQHAIVLRVADVLPLPAAAQVVLGRLAGLIATETDTPPSANAWQAAGVAHAGYLAIPVGNLAPLNIVELVAAQEAVCAYQDGRRARGYPARVEACAACDQRGCGLCGGGGSIVTLVEMDETEMRLSSEPIKLED